MAVFWDMEYVEMVWIAQFREYHFMEAQMTTPELTNRCLVIVDEKCPAPMSAPGDDLFMITLVLLIFPIIIALPTFFWRNNGH